MPQKTKKRTKNPLLSVIMQMAAARGESLLDFAARFDYSPETINLLEKNPWFHPSTRTMWVLMKEMEISLREENALVRLAEAAHQKDDAMKKEELLLLYDLMPSDVKHSVINRMRQVAEDRCARKN